MIGTQVSHYRILAELGRGGMGVAYLAEDTILNRKVALKFLHPDAVKTPEAEARLMREARAASVLDHPAIATIHEVGEWEGQHFIVMAFCPGETLAARLSHGPLPVSEAVSLLIRIADAISAAHAAGIVHRDLKPGNIMLTPEGLPKILDFGLAMQESTENETAPRLTLTGSTLGTIAYMSPEQAKSAPVDHRTDVWALGVIAFEMLAGQLPFRGAHQAALLHAIIYEPAAALRETVPRAIRDVVTKALKKDVDARYASAANFATDLRAWQATTSGAGAPTAARATLGRLLVGVPVAAVLIALGVMAWQSYQQAETERWAREEAIPEVAKLIDAERFAEAFALAQRAEAAVPGDPSLARLRPALVRTPSFKSTPDGVTVAFKPYAAADADWTTVGVTPLDGAQVPAGFYRWRFSKEGYETVELSRGSGPAAPLPQTTISVLLAQSTFGPRGMVAVPGGPEPFSVFLPGFETLAPVRLSETYWIDRFEVTNAEYKAFVDAGGYAKHEFWQEPLIEGGRQIPWDEAMTRFRDATGRPGPAAWVQGEFPQGQGSWPVGGVSWYEAAAYARFAGKQLPTLYHWTKAAEPRASVFVVPLSNLAGDAPVEVGSRAALHQWGTEDMAGNVKEWVTTDAGDGRRYILGGAWDEPTYVFNEPDAQSPWERRPTFGFRCITPSETIRAELLAPIRWPTRDYAKEKPAPDAVFDIYRRLYDYDATPIRAEPVVDDRDENWRREMVSFPAGYGGEQTKLFLYLPRKPQPPFQTVIYFPGANYLRTRSFDQIPTRDFDYIVKSGRAVALPVLKGTFDRQTALDDSTANQTVLYRDHVIAWIRDVRRSIDYLETRDDLSLDTLALVGRSWGGRMGSILPALESRLKSEVLIIGGFSMQQAQPEVDQINFAPRVKIPVLMLNGRYDFFFPTDTSQKPMFETLGTPREHKRHVLFDGGHGIPRLDMIRETLAWLDQYQGTPRR